MKGRVSSLTVFSERPVMGGRHGKTAENEPRACVWWELNGRWTTLPVATLHEVDEAVGRNWLQTRVVSRKAFVPLLVQTSSGANFLFG